MGENLQKAIFLLVGVFGVFGCSYVRVESQNGLLDPSTKKFSAQAFVGQKVVLTCSTERLPEKIADGLCDHVDELLTLHGAEVYPSYENLEQSEGASSKQLQPIAIEMNSKLQAKEESGYLSHALFYLTYGFWPVESRKAYKVTLNASSGDQTLPYTAEMHFAVRKVTGFATYLGQATVNWLYRSKSEEMSTSAASERLTFWLDRRILNAVYRNQFALRLQAEQGVAQ